MIALAAAGVVGFVLAIVAFVGPVVRGAQAYADQERALSDSRLGRGGAR